MPEMIITKSYLGDPQRDPLGAIRAGAVEQLYKVGSHHPQAVLVLAPSSTLPAAPRV